MTNFTDLKRRVEEATGPDRELDDAIWMALCHAGHWREIARGSPQSRFTASIDATVALIERVMPGKTWVILNRAMREISDRRNGIVSNISADVIARAALAALLSACEQGG